MGKKVFIGVGHGGADAGAVKYIMEKEYTLKTAFALAEYLSEYGIDYKMSRTQDIDTDLNDKVRMCNAYAPDLVVDIHFNAGGGKGLEVYYSCVGGTSKKLAENINAEAKKIMTSRGVKTKIGNGGSDYFGIIRDTSAPAVLCEGGFVDNNDDATFIKANYKKLAKAYADGIAKTLNVSKPKTTNKALTVLDSSGYKKGDASIGVLALKSLLLLAKTVGMTDCGMDNNKSFGNGTEKAVNTLLSKWGYKLNGIAGQNFIKRLRSELEKKVK